MPPTRSCRLQPSAKHSAYRSSVATSGSEVLVLVLLFVLVVVLLVDVDMDVLLLVELVDELLLVDELKLVFVVVLLLVDELELVFVVVLLLVDELELVLLVLVMLLFVDELVFVEVNTIPAASKQPALSAFCLWLPPDANLSQHDSHLYIPGPLNHSRKCPTTPSARSHPAATQPVPPV